MYASIQYDRKEREKDNANKPKESDPNSHAYSRKLRELQDKKAISVTRLDSSSLIWLASLKICPRLYRIGDTAFLTSPSSSSIIEPNEVGERIPGKIDDARSGDDALRDSVPTTLRRRLENDVLTESRLWGSTEGVNWSS